ncbi:heat-shock protein IbpA [bacterium]|nr:heat-shock protein IbpA [bacterium]
MTYHNLFPVAFKDFDKFFVGFDDTYNKLSKLHDDVTKNIPNYPPYNIRKVEDNKYVIELAVAGFSSSDVEITFEDNKLIVSGRTHDDSENFLFKGIANRAFTRTFALDDQIVIDNAEMINGMLKIALERIIPDHKKPRKIEVKNGEAASSSKKQLLVEEDDRNL